jgi:uncharacterized membrane protein
MGYIKVAAEYVAYVIEGAAVLIILLGASQAFLHYLRRGLTRLTDPTVILDSRLKLGHTLSLGLGFLVGADVILTAVSPTWEEIGHLAAIVAIRIVLNFFLMKDLKQVLGVSHGSQARTEQYIRHNDHRYEEGMK